MQITPRERGERVRCPYCHDLLAEEVLEPITCTGCGTVHHRACLEELGRCTVLGCEAGLTFAHRSEPSGPQYRQILRKRVRRRARAYAETQAKRSPPPRPQEPLAPIRRAEESFLFRIHDWAARNPELGMPVLLLLPLVVMGLICLAGYLILGGLFGLFG